MIVEYLGGTQVLHLPVGDVRKVNCKNYYYAPVLFGEGNGTPLQYSCLENPMDGGAW